MKTISMDLSDAEQQKSTDKWTDRESMKSTVRNKLSVMQTQKKSEWADYAAVQA